jgi:hypothetical protein
VRGQGRRGGGSRLQRLQHVEREARLGFSGEKIGTEPPEERVRGRRPGPSQQRDRVLLFRQAAPRQHAGSLSHQTVNRGGQQQRQGRAMQLSGRILAQRRVEGAGRRRIPPTVSREQAQRLRPQFG